MCLLSELVLKLRFELFWRWFQLDSIIVGIFLNSIEVNSVVYKIFSTQFNQIPSFHKFYSTQLHADSVSTKEIRQCNSIHSEHSQKRIPTQINLHREFSWAELNWMDHFLNWVAQLCTIFNWSITWLEAWYNKTSAFERFVVDFRVESYKITFKASK